ncbi:FAD-dependent monooxygenase [Amycolatopsis sulphurea]|uniref:FAD-dependent monooxygenase n=1 Tax=Amycolatopsis sulphurea TaxID=76022 RepID=UPI001FE8EC51|nr:FAD-dependent monooxygenase [Amycolatopsis sulphurea]
MTDFTEMRCRRLVQTALGRGIDVEIVGVAERYRAGKVFLVGDSAHVRPPAGALAGVQDARKLTWKLAAVLRGASRHLRRRAPALAERLAPTIVAHQEARMSGQAEPEGTDPHAQIFGVC